MKKLILLLLSILALNSEAATVWFPLTNFNGTMLTNSLKIARVSDVVTVDGQYLQAGVPITVRTTNGVGTNILQANNYGLWINGTTNKPVYFAVPDDTNTYNVTSLLISGANFFRPSGVLQIVAGTNVTISPSNGKGVVTVNASGGGSGSGVTNVFSAQFGKVNNTNIYIADGAPLTNNTLYGTVTADGLTASRVVVSGASKQLQSSAVTTTELGYVSGVTGLIQTQLDAKQASGAAAGGDLGGTYPNPTISGLAQSKVSSLVTDLAGKVSTNVMYLPRTVIVHKAGNDSTGARQRMDLPFLTLNAAKTAASEGDTIIVYSGLYSNGINLLKNNVNWHFMLGATNIITGNNSGETYMFTDNGNAITSSVSGQGTFIVAPGDVDNLNGVLQTTHGDSVVNFEGKEAINDSTSGGFGGLYLYTFRIATCKYLNLKLNAIKSIPSDNVATPVWWQRGDMYASIDYIQTGDGGYGVWCDQDTVYAAEPASSLYLYSKLIEGAIWYYPDTLKGKFWLDVGEIKAGANSPAIQYTVGIPGEGGKFYLNAQKVSNNSTTFPTLLFEGPGPATGGQSWMTIQKLSSSFRYIDGGFGTNYLEIGHFEQTGAITNGISITNGTYFIKGQTLSATNGAGFVYSGGKVMLEGYLIKAPTPISLLSSANELRLKNLVLSATSPNPSINSAAARTVGTYGVWANTAKGASVTVYPTNGLSVDALVK